jgi:TM2 domain-containing membrane protein YozV
MKEDVRKLLIASWGVFAAAVIYCLATAAGIAFLTNLLFVLIPFSIIGVWIFALMLYTKYSYEDPSKSDKPGKKKIYSQKRAFLLSGFLGIFGAHRFYLGYTNMGLFQMFTLGGFFILSFIDMLNIKHGKLKPKNGDYGTIDPNYKNTRKKLAPNKSQKLIKLALGLSLLALIAMLSAAIFL